MVAYRVNIESDLLLSVVRRSMTRLGKLIRSRVKISNEPSDLKLLAQHNGAMEENIVKIYHQRMFYDATVKRTEAVTDG